MLARIESRALTPRWLNNPRLLTTRLSSISNARIFAKIFNFLPLLLIKVSQVNCTLFWRIYLFFILKHRMFLNIDPIKDLFDYKIGNKLDTLWKYLKMKIILYKYMLSYIINDTKRLQYIIINIIIIINYNNNKYIYNNTCIILL